MVARTLATAGHRVIGLYYTTTPTQTGFFWAHGDTRDIETMSRLVVRCDAVIYCASRPRKIATQAERSWARIEGVRVLCGVVKERPLLYLSSKKVDWDHASDPYVQAQVACEKLVRGCKKGDVLRLPAIYGPGHRRWIGWIRWLSPLWMKKTRSVYVVAKHVAAWVKDLPL